MIYYLLSNLIISTSIIWHITYQLSNLNYQLSYISYNMYLSIYLSLCLPVCLSVFHPSIARSLSLFLSLPLSLGKLHRKLRAYSTRLYPTWDDDQTEHSYSSLCTSKGYLHGELSLNGGKFLIHNGHISDYCRPHISVYHKDQNETAGLKVCLSTQRRLGTWLTYKS